MEGRISARVGCLCAGLSMLLGLMPASATEVSWSFAGTIIDQSGDVAGLVGLSGSVIGAPISGSFGYDTGVFGSPSAVSNSVGHVWDSTDGSLPNGVLRISETINGVTFGFDGLYYNGMVLAYGSSGGGAWPYSDWTQAIEVVSEHRTPYGIDAAEINVGRLDEAVALVDPALDPAGPFDLGALQIDVNTTNWFTAAGLASWSFAIDRVEPIAAPGGSALLGVGVAGLATMRRRGWRAG